MDNLFKRILSLVLAVLMVVSYIPTSALATDGAPDVPADEGTVVDEPVNEPEEDVEAAAEGNVCEHPEEMQSISAQNCTDRSTFVRQCECGATLALKDDDTAFDSHDYKVVEVVEPTCQHGGYTLVKCTRCEAKDETEHKDSIACQYGDDYICEWCGSEDPEKPADGGQEGPVFSEEEQAFRDLFTVSGSVYLEENVNYNDLLTSQPIIIQQGVEIVLYLNNKGIRINSDVMTPTFTVLPGGKLTIEDEGFGCVSGIQNQGTLIINGGGAACRTFPHPNAGYILQPAIMNLGEGVLEINGGTFSLGFMPEDMPAPPPEATMLVTGNSSNITITGGTFTRHETIVANSIAEGYELVENEFGEFNVVKSQGGTTGGDVTADFCPAHPSGEHFMVGDGVFPCCIEQTNVALMCRYGCSYKTTGTLAANGLHTFENGACKFCETPDMTDSYQAQINAGGTINVTGHWQLSRTLEVSGKVKLVFADGFVSAVSGNAFKVKNGGTLIVEGYNKDQDDNYISVLSGVEIEQGGIMVHKEGNLNVIGGPVGNGGYSVINNGTLYTDHADKPQNPVIVIGDGVVLPYAEYVETPDAPPATENYCPNNESGHILVGDGVRPTCVDQPNVNLMCRDCGYKTTGTLAAVPGLHNIMQYGGECENGCGKKDDTPYYEELFRAGGKVSFSEGMILTKTLVIDKTVSVDIRNGSVGCINGTAFRIADGGVMILTGSNTDPNGNEVACVTGLQVDEGGILVHKSGKFNGFGVGTDNFFNVVNNGTIYTEESNLIQRADSTGEIIQDMTNAPAAATADYCPSEQNNHRHVPGNLMKQLPYTLPTCTENGRGALACIFGCGYYAENVILGAPGHKFDENGKCTACGESNKTTVVAVIGDAEYATIQAAIDAAQEGDTITLMADVSNDAANTPNPNDVEFGEFASTSAALKVASGKKLTLDLNDHFITISNNQTAAFALLENNGELTIANTGPNGWGSITYTDTGAGGEYISDTIQNNGTLNLVNGVISNMSSAEVAAAGYPHAIDNFGTLTITGGNVACFNYSAIRMYCANNSKQNEVSISGNVWVIGAIDVQNATSAAAQGKLTITGGNFELGSSKYNIRFANWNGGADAYGPTAEIKGGTFEGGITSQFVPAAANWNSKVVSGGTFGANVTAYVADGYAQLPNGSVAEAKHAPQEDTYVAPEVNVPQSVPAEVQNQQTAKDAKDDIKNNTAVNVKPAGLESEKNKEAVEAAKKELEVPEDAYVEITVKVELSNIKAEVAEDETEKVTNLTFDVTPVIAYAGETAKIEVAEAITFRLPIPSNFAADYVDVYHYDEKNKRELIGDALQILGEGANRYVEVSHNEFSPIEVVATETPAEPTEVQVSTLEELIAALASDGTLPILVTKTIEIPAGETVALDLNGKQITAAFAEGSATNHLYVFTNRGTLTIKDTVGGGVINTRGIYNYGDLTLTSGTINAIDANGGYGVKTYANGTFTMTGGTVAAIYEDGDPAVSGNYDATPISIDEGATVSITGGKITNASNFTAAITNAGELEIENVEIEAVFEAVASSGTLTIKGGSYEVTDPIGGHAVYITAGTVNIEGGTFTPYTGKQATSYGVYASDGTVSITGGIFQANAFGKILCTADDGEIKVSGGTFDVNPKDFVVDGFKPVENADGTYGVQVAKTYVAEVNGQGYETLAEAVAIGGEVKVLTDIALAAPITVSKDVTLDLNGKVISGVNNTGSGALIKVANSGKLTVKDSSAEQTGKITYAEGTSNVGWAVYVEGELVLESGTIELTGSWSIGYAVDVRPNAWGSNYANPTVFTMNGGKLVSSGSAVRVASSSSDSYSNISASFEMNAGKIQAAGDGVFIQQSNDAYDTLSFTLNGGNIEADKYPVRVYGPAPTEAEDCMTIALNGGQLVGGNQGTNAALMEGKVYMGGGMTADTLLANGSVTASAAFAQANTMEGYGWKKTGSTYTLMKIVAPNAVVENLGSMTLEAGAYDIFDGSLKESTEDLSLQIALNFKTEDTLADAQASYYGKWKTDFYLTFNGLADGATEFNVGSSYLAGNYGTYGWIAVPASYMAQTLETGVEYPVVSGYDSNITYEQICDSVKNFIAAIYIDPAILEANPDFTVTLNLKMVNPDDDTDVLTVGEGFTFGFKDLVPPAAPNATVTRMDPMTLTAADKYMVWPSGDATIDRPLQAVVNFQANETVEEIKGTYYEKWLVDFNLEFDGLANGTITADDCYLAGNYGTYGWIVIPTDDMELAEDTKYPVVSAYDATLNYKDICKDVKNFTAAIHVAPAILEANPDFKVTLTLVMTDPENANKTLTIGDPIIFTAEQLLAYQGEKYVAQIGEEKFTTLAAAVANAQADDQILLLDNITLTETVVIDKPVSILSGTEEGAGVYTVTAVNCTAFEFQTSGGIFNMNIAVEKDENAGAAPIYGVNVTRADAAVFLAADITGDADVGVNMISNGTFEATEETPSNLQVYSKIEAAKAINIEIAGSRANIAGGAALNANSADGVLTVDAKNVVVDLFGVQLNNADPSSKAFTVNGDNVIINAHVQNAESLVQTGAVARIADSYYSSIADAVAAGNMIMHVDLLASMGEFTVDHEIIIYKNGHSAEVKAANYYHVDAEHEINGRAAYGVFLNNPEAKVTDLTAEEMVDAPDLTFAKKFTAVVPEDENVVDALMEKFGSYYADYELTITGMTSDKVVFNAEGTADGYLAGSFDNFNNGAWLQVPFADVEIENGKTFKIMEYAAELMGNPDLKITCSDVFTMVQEFRCGVFFDADFLAANPDMKVNLSLKMYDPEDPNHIIEVGSYDFTAPTVVAKIGDVGYPTLDAAIEAAEQTDTIVLLADIEQSGIQSGEITLDLNGHVLETNTTDVKKIKANGGRFVIFNTSSIADESYSDYSHFKVDKNAVIFQNIVNSKTQFDFLSGKTTLTGGRTINGADMRFVVSSDAEFTVGKDVDLTIKSNGYLKVEDGAKLTVNGNIILASEEAYVETSIEDLNVITKLEGKKVEYKDGKYHVANELKDMIAGASISAENSLELYFYVNKSTMEGTDYSVRITKTFADDTNDYVIEVPFSEWVNYSGALYQVAFGNIAAKEMADVIYVEVTDGEGNVVSNVWVDSVRDYAMRRFDAVSETGKTLFVDLLNYGAAAQDHLDYGEDDFANSILTDAQKAYATQNVTTQNNVVRGPNYAGSQIQGESRIVFTLYFRNINRDMYAMVEYTDHNGKAHSDRVEGTEFVLYTGGLLGVTINELAAADARQLVSVTVYDANGTEVASAKDSVESYANRMSTGNGDVFDMLFKFATSAYAFLHNK